MMSALRRPYSTVLCFATLLFAAANSHAYYSTIDTGQILPKKSYRVSAEPQVMLGDSGGFNLAGRFDAGMTESSNVRLLLGTGKVSFQTGVFYKWVPIPDYENQPALGIMGGFLYGRKEDINTLSLRLHPIVSKTFTFDYGSMTPYASLPVGASFRKDETVYPVQLALGTEWKTNDWDKLTFIGEVGLNIASAFSYVSVAAVLYFDDEQGPRIE